MKGNSHKKLFHVDHFAWKYYCANAARRQRKLDKRMAVKAARKERKAIK